MSFENFLKKNNFINIKSDEISNYVFQYSLDNLKSNLNRKKQKFVNKKDMAYIYDNFTKNPDDYVELIERNYCFKLLPEEIKYNKKIMVAMLKNTKEYIHIPLYWYKDNKDMVIKNLRHNKFLVEKLLKLNDKHMYDKIVKEIKYNSEIALELKNHNINLECFSKSETVIDYVMGFELFRQKMPQEFTRFISKHLKNERLSVEQQSNIKLIKKIIKIAPYYVEYLNFNDYINEKDFYKYIEPILDNYIKNNNNLNIISVIDWKNNIRSIKLNKKINVDGKKHNMKKIKKKI